MAAATMDWPPPAASRINGLAEAYADDNDDDDDDNVVNLVEFPAPTQPAPPASESAAAEDELDEPVAGATLAKGTNMVGGGDDGAIASPTPAEGQSSSKKPAGTVAEAGDDATTEKNHISQPTRSTADTTRDTTTPPPPPSTHLRPPNSAATITSSDMNSVRSEFSSPLRHRAVDEFAPSSPLSEMSDVAEYDFDYDESSGHRLIRLKPTAAQWDDFPALLAFARKLGARNDGCFKLQLPADLRQPLPRKEKRVLPANAYKAKQVRRTTFWQLSTVKAEGEFYTPEDVDAEPTQSVDETLKTLKTVFRKNMGRQMRFVRYRPDVPAWNSEQRLEAGVPPNWSPIHPLRGDMLDRTKAVVPGIHTPYVYESAPHFGATFQIHAEDYRLLSLNHLYRGRKIWIVVPCTAIDVAEQALGRGADGCSQFMRHRAEFFFPEKLDKLGIPYRIVDQRPGETIVILPDAYHQGYSTGYTLAEAKNYADDEWSTETYKPCAAHCQLLTAIPPEYMRLLADGEERLDLCKLHDQHAADAKRAADDMAAAEDGAQGEAKRVKVE